MVCHPARTEEGKTEAKLVSANAIICFQMLFNVRPFEQHRGPTTLADFEMRNHASRHPVLDCPRRHPKTRRNFQLGQVSFLLWNVFFVHRQLQKTFSGLIYLFITN